MIYRRREEFEEFGEHILQETEGCGGGSIEILMYAPFGFHLVVAVGETAEFGICRDSGGAVPGDLHLRDYSDASLAGIFHDLADIILGIESPMRNAIAYSAVPGGFLAPGTYFGKSGVLVDLDSPALVLCEMPMEHVLLIHRHQVDKLHYLFFWEEKTAAVEKQSTIPELGFVVDGAAGSKEL